MHEEGVILKIAIVRMYVKDVGRYAKVHQAQKKPSKHRGLSGVYLRDPRCTKVLHPSRIPT